MDEIIYTADLVKDLTLTKTGEWVHQGSPVTHQNTIALFNRSIVWDEEDQKFYLQIGKGRAAFKVEDTAYFVRSIDESESPWKVVLADESSEELDASTFSAGNENQIYCQLQNGHRARLSRSAHQALLTHAADDEHLLVDGEKIKL